MKLRTALLTMALPIAASFTPPSSSLSTKKSSSSLPAIAAGADTTAEVQAVPPLKARPPRKVALLIEPTPFTHISGYANRFNELLRYLSKAGDHVDILTVDSKTPKEELPTEAFGYDIEHTQGFVFPLYNHISLTVDLPEMKGAKMMERRRPDLIHVTSPYVDMCDVGF